jgi:hypothetical protein
VSIRTKVGFGLISFLAVAAMIGVACGTGGTGTKSAGGSVQADEGGAVPAPTRAQAFRPADDVPAVLGEFQLPGISQRIISTATLTIHVRKDSFDQRFQQAAMVASSHGGFISSSKTMEGGRPSGVLVIRVPASQFELAMGELKALGKAKGEWISGEDVTARFVDLQARLRNWEAQESVLLRLMSRSKSIEDSLKVQRTLQEVQLAIEEINGQLRVMSDQTDLSTITLSMAESATVAPKPKADLTFVRAWHQAIHAIAAVLAAIVIGLGYVLPIALVALGLLVAWFGVRRLWPRMAGGTPSGSA